MSGDKLTAASFEKATAETERLQRELDITNADHIALWLEANVGDIPGDGIPIPWLACRIIDAHEAVTTELMKALPVIIEAAEPMRLREEADYRLGKSFRNPIEKAIQTARKALTLHDRALGR